MFLIQIKNIFACRQANVACWQANVACSMLACQFRHVDLATGETGKKSDQAPNTDVGQTMLASFARPQGVKNLS